MTSDHLYWLMFWMCAHVPLDVFLAWMARTF